jgi:hypothetical protein
MAWEKRIASAKSKPATVEELALALKADFERLADRCGDRMCAGMSRCLFFHQAYEWGAPIAFAEVGEQTPCASLQFAFLRGAARQYHGRPWGTSLVNEFCGAVADARYLPQASQTIWTMPNQVRGAQCGHSPSLELRLAMAAHLAGATFVQDESDARNGSSFVQEDESGLHTLSPFGTNLKTVHQFMGDFPQRGVPYTPVAFVVDFHRCWQLGEENFGPWSPEASDRSIEAMFRHVYAYDGHCDFERGILTSSPYGDLFDVITDNAPRGVLGTYGVLWPLGNVVIGGAHQEAMVDYVKKGGILILDAFIAKVFASQFLGVAFGTDIGVATQIQTPLAALPPLAAPYLYRGMTVSRNTGVLAWTDTGAPLLTWRKSGKGLVLVAASEHWLDQRNQLLPLAPALLRAIADAFSPVQVSADVQVLINRDADGWILGLINNNGVSKVPTQPATADPKDMADCMIYFKKGVPLQFISRFGQFGWNNTANGLHTRLQPGELAVVKAAFTSDAQR